MTPFLIDQTKFSEIMEHNSRSTINSIEADIKLIDAYSKYVKFRTLKNSRNSLASWESFAALSMMMETVIQENTSLNVNNIALSPLY